MGKILVQIFRIVEEKGGLPGRLRLAQMTGITQQRASELKDKADIVKHAKKVASEILASDINVLLK